MTRDLRTILEHVGEGVGIVDATGALVWANAQLRRQRKSVRERFLEVCRRGLAHVADEAEPDAEDAPRPGRRLFFSAGRRDYEVLISTAAGTDKAAIGVLWEITSSRRLQGKIDAIDAAGAELLRLEADAIQRLNVAERLTLLGERIGRAVEDLLKFDHFEIRLIDRESNRLELVFAHGLTPLKIGHVIHAAPQGNGICGYVAATGRSYICHDVPGDPLYTEGLPGAQSTLTVPLRLHERVIGVLNVESVTPLEFDEEDRLFAEIFGRYIAMAMHILDLLVVERYTTNEQVASNVLSELAGPLETISAQAAALRDGGRDAERAGLDRIVEAAAVIRRRLEAYSTGPKSIIGAEQELRGGEPDPLLLGKRVIVADNEPAVLEAITSLLRMKGCDVTPCLGGAETIEKLREAAASRRQYDLVISDIRMPDRTGYEVFRQAQEISTGVPVILITGFGYDPHHSIVRANQEGLHSFLFKPLKASQLLEAIAKALAK